MHNDRGHEIKTVTVDGQIRTVGRPDLYGGGMSWARTIAKRPPKYVYSTRHGKLLHEVLRMELTWWELGGGGGYWFRVQQPRVNYLSRCGYWFYGGWPGSEVPGMKRSKSTVCELPAEDAVLCGRCRGEGPVFGKHLKQLPGGPTYKEARARLGCVAKAEEHGDS